ncbi:MAG: peptidoglycan DD-metalloendopeptidase family protein [Fidelibacterota bacterium]|nr:MAG: peptidoglycan DD-metalloendopeptidase family protein [Candidatus Neomarinimicrobiota bacterium]
MRRFCRYTLIAVCLGLVALGAQTVQDVEELDRQIGAKQNELRQLREEIRLYERRIARQEQAEKDALNVLFELEERISLTSRLIKALETESQQLTRAINLTQQLIRQSEAEIAALKEKLAERFAHVYKQRRSTMLELILTSDNWNQAAYRAKYLKVAADYDRNLTRMVKSEIRRLEGQKQKLARDRVRKQEAIRERAREEELLRTNKTERQRQIAKIKQDRHNDERLLLQKRRDVAELERIIAGLEFDRERRAKELAEMRRKLDLAAVADISYYQGKLPWPTSGRVVTRFGPQRNPQLNTITENPGIDIQTAPGTAVKSVLDGLVTTITYIRTYGTTVIIDHGKDLYSVYALLDDVSVSEGQYVDQGQLIARVGSDGGLSEARLHFEIWANQVKQDPANWLLAIP